jgi:hypothetical protein
MVKIKIEYLRKIALKLCTGKLKPVTLKKYELENKQNCLILFSKLSSKEQMKTVSEL